MEAIKEALTFDDVLLLPRFSKVLPIETDISINLSKNIRLSAPFLSFSPLNLDAASAAFDVTFLNFSTNDLSNAIYDRT